MNAIDTDAAENSASGGKLPLFVGISSMLGMLGMHAFLAGKHHRPRTASDVLASMLHALRGDGSFLLRALLLVLRHAALLAGDLKYVSHHRLLRLIERVQTQSGKTPDGRGTDRRDLALSIEWTAAFGPKKPVRAALAKALVALGRFALISEEPLTWAPPPRTVAAGAAPDVVAVAEAQAGVDAEAHARSVRVNELARLGTEAWQEMGRAARAGGASDAQIRAFWQVLQDAVRVRARDDREFGALLWAHQHRDDRRRKMAYARLQSASLSVTGEILPGAPKHLTNAVLAEHALALAAAVHGSGATAPWLRVMAMLQGRSDRHEHSPAWVNAQVGTIVARNTALAVATEGAAQSIERRVVRALAYAWGTRREVAAASIDGWLRIHGPNVTPLLIRDAQILRDASLPRFRVFLTLLAGGRRRCTAEEARERIRALIEAAPIGRRTAAILAVRAAVFAEYRGATRVVKATPPASEREAARMLAFVLSLSSSVKTVAMKRIAAAAKAAGAPAPPPAPASPVDTGIGPAASVSQDTTGGAS